MHADAGSRMQSASGGGSGSRSRAVNKPLLWAGLGIKVGRGTETPASRDLPTSSSTLNFLKLDFDIWRKCAGRILPYLRLPSLIHDSLVCVSMDKPDDFSQPTVLGKHQIEKALHDERREISSGRLKEENPLDTTVEFRRFCEACRRGDLRACQEQIGKGININARDEFDYTPLILVRNTPNATQSV